MWTWSRVPETLGFLIFMKPRGGSDWHPQVPATGTCPGANGTKGKKVRFEVMSAVTMKKTVWVVTYGIVRWMCTVVSGKPAESMNILVEEWKTNLMPLVILFHFLCAPHVSDINRLTPKDPYMGRTTPLTSKRCILYIYSTNIGTEYFKHVLYSPFFSLQNAVCFIMLTCLVPVLFTFYIQGVLKLKN